MVAMTEDIFYTHHAFVCLPPELRGRRGAKAGKNTAGQTTHIRSLAPLVPLRRDRQAKEGNTTIPNHIPFWRFCRFRRESHIDSSSSGPTGFQKHKQALLPDGFLLLVERNLHAG